METTYVEREEALTARRALHSVPLLQGVVQYHTLYGWCIVPARLYGLGELGRHEAGAQEKGKKEHA